MIGAREEILERLGRSQSPMSVELAAGYRPPSIADLAATFLAKATASYAKTHEVEMAEAVPEAIFAILSHARAEPLLHIPKNARLWNLPWHRAPQITLTDAPPGADDTALSTADCAIAETGTLVFFSGPARPAAWHFLPGRELVLISRANIRATFEDVASAMAANGLLPCTLNLVTGPSRTGDIEQTMELGAHGPREVHILIVA